MIVRCVFDSAIVTARHIHLHLILKVFCIFLSLSIFITICNIITYCSSIIILCVLILSLPSILNFLITNLNLDACIINRMFSTNNTPTTVIKIKKLNQLYPTWIIISIANSIIIYAIINELPTHVLSIMINDNKNIGWFHHDFHEWTISNVPFSRF